ncbi:cyclomaltodextrinase [Glaciihabitans tibetensis]|uniref:Cyclomaltodextrinase n=1 Tax=Glaciihabitans tibetensis TaxID=1266600 RepID=A0A2T0V9Z5_9MICO|nr:alpha-amylase family protein [Glaciihabitans tibetensis]PRY67002.1 cyclomaltodextrinase [Glaciihabitans tibetensis]
MTDAELNSPVAERTEPDWVTHAVWWQIYPLGFVGAPQSQAAGEQDAGPNGAQHVSEHRLDRITDWLDYAIELGASGIALGPIFQSETHGYDTTDYFAIDSRLGDTADFRRLIAEAHSRGLRVLLDGVFNHVGRGFPRFQAVLEGADATAASNWFTRTDSDVDAHNGGFASFEGHSALVELNHFEPAVVDFVVDVMTHWLGLGADGWRLDAAYAVAPEFWATVLPRVRAAHPGAYIVGEVLHGDYAAFVAESGVDSVTQYELWKAIWSAVSEANFFELAWALDRHSEFLQSFTPLTFVGNHDVTRIASAIGDARHLPHALVVLFTVGGTPSIYYGDEQAFVGVKEQRAGGDDAVRPEFPAGGRGDLAPEGWAIFHVHQELIGLRRRHPWLHTAAARTLQLTNENYVYELTDGHERLVVSLNLGDAAGTLQLPEHGDIVAGEASATRHPAGTTLDTPPHGWVVLALEPDAR